MRELLAERGIELVTRARAAHVTDDVLWLEERRAIIGDTVVSLPVLEAPTSRGSRPMSRASCRRMRTAASWAPTLSSRPET